MLSYCAIIERIDAAIQDYIKKVGKIQKSVVQSVIFGGQKILNAPVYAQNPHRFYQNIEREQENKVCYKKFLHYLSRFMRKIFAKIGKKNNTLGRFQKSLRTLSKNLPETF